MSGSWPSPIIREQVKVKVPRKKGPRDIGWNNTFKPAKFKFEKPEDGDFLRERFCAMKNIGKKVKRKLGAIQIGRNDTYDVAKYDWKAEDTADFLAERLYPRKKSPKQRVTRKVGAIETGWIDTYDVAVFEHETPKDGNFLSERLTYKSTSGGEVKRKEGAIETGRNVDYNAASFTFEGAAGSDFLKERLAVSPKSQGRSKRDAKSPRKNRERKCPSKHRKEQKSVELVFEASKLDGLTKEFDKTWNAANSRTEKLPRKRRSLRKEEVKRKDGATEMGRKTKCKAAWIPYEGPTGSDFLKAKLTCPCSPKNETNISPRRAESKSAMESKSPRIRRRRSVTAKEGSRHKRKRSNQNSVELVIKGLNFVKLTVNKGDDSISREMKAEHKPERQMLER